MPKENPKWLDNSIQFPRLIVEAEAVGCFAGQQFADLAEEMDLTRLELYQLIERAHAEWEKVKTKHCPLKPTK